MNVIISSFFFCFVCYSELKDRKKTEIWKVVLFLSLTKYSQENRSCQIFLGGYVFGIHKQLDKYR